jgi:hypothetical protein
MASMLSRSLIFTKYAQCVRHDALVLNKAFSTTGCHLQQKPPGQKKTYVRDKPHMNIGTIGQYVFSQYLSDVNNVCVPVIMFFM